MAWSAPRTWIPGETVTASLMNAHIRDDFNIVKTSIDDGGLLKVDQYNRGSAVQNGTTVETDLATYTIPGSHLSVNGYSFTLETWGHLAANGNTKTFRWYHAGVLLHSFATTVSGASWNAWARVTRRGASSVVEVTYLQIGGAATYNTSTAVATSFQQLITWDSHTPVLSSPQILKLTGQSGTATGDLVSDAARGYRGAVYA